MIECDICLKRINIKNKRKHLKSKRHNYYSNFVINKYCEQNVNKKYVWRGTLNYQSLHRKKFTEFEVEIRWKIKDNLEEAFLGSVVKLCS